jgi:hypothetical protein
MGASSPVEPEIMGAQHGYSVRTSGTMGMIAVVYPDKESWDRVSVNVLQIREEAVPAMSTQMIGATEGEAGVVA